MYLTVQKFDDYTKVKENATEVGLLNDRLIKAKEKVESFN
jgi:dynein heavy chain